MEGLPASSWLGILVSSLLGSLMFAILKPNNIWWKGAPGVIVSTGTGLMLTPAVCEWNGITSTPQHYFAAFLTSLLAMIVCRALIAISEEQTVEIIKDLILRVIGRSAPPTNPTPPAQPTPRMDSDGEPL